MKKGILIVGDENEIGMKLLEQQLSERLKRRDYPVEGEYFWPGEKETGVFRFRQKGHERVLSTDWILYLEKDMRRIFVHLENGGKISFYGRMEEVLEQLGKRFCQCHKSYVVNLDKVLGMTETSFHLKGGAEIPIGQRRHGKVSLCYKEHKEQKNLEKLRFFESFSCFEM